MSIRKDGVEAGGGSTVVVRADIGVERTVLLGKLDTAHGNLL